MKNGTAEKIALAAILVLVAALAGCRDVSCVAGLGCSALPAANMVKSCLWSDTVVVHYAGTTEYVIRSGHDTTCVLVDGTWQRRRDQPRAWPRRGHDTP